MFSKANQAKLSIKPSAILWTCLLAFACANLASSDSQAQTASKNELLQFDEVLGLVQGLFLNVEDQATGRCWTNIAQVKAKARLIPDPEIGDS
jgi:hypothetical protein